jgi:CBS domain containing-hemolysin-like protein
VVSADRFKLRADAARGSRGAKLAIRMLEKPEWLLSTTLVGTNIAVVANTTVATALVMQLFGPHYAWVAIVIVAPLIWIFGEIVPKSIFQQRANSITPRVIVALRYFSILFAPILLVFSFFARFLGRMVGDRPRSKNPFTLRQQFMTMMSMTPGEGEIDPHGQLMIRRLFTFGEIPVREIVIPLIDLVSIDENSRSDEVIQLGRKSAHNRIMVHRGRVDHIVGVIDTLDLLGVGTDQPIQEYIRPVDYVPGSRIIQDVLLDLRHTRRDIMVVLDEFGGSSGIVTLEEIDDVYDLNERPTPWIRKLGEREYLASGRVEPHVLAERLSINLPEGHYVSLAGFLLEKAREMPAEGTSIEYQDISFIVEKATPQVIQEIRIRW